MKDREGEKKEEKGLSEQVDVKRNNVKYDHVRIAILLCW
jgi:hypothetical protein